MTASDMNDAVLRRLSRLPAPVPDAARAARVVARCQADLARRQRRRLQRRWTSRPFLAPAIVAAFSLVYVVAIVHTVLRWRGLD